MGKNIFKYLLNFNLAVLLIGGPVLFFLLFIWFFIGAIIDGEDIDLITSVIITVFIIAINVYLIGLEIKRIKNLKNAIMSVEQNLLLDDFQSAETVLNGKLKLGNQYVYGKGSDRLLKYEELKQVYVFVQKFNGIEVTRILRAIDENGKLINLCRLKLRGKNSEELKKAIIFFAIKNPNIKVGY